MTDGTYHCELGDCPARVVLDSGDMTALRVEFPDRVETIHVPTDKLGMVFTPNGSAQTKASASYATKLVAANEKRLADDAADAGRLAASE